MNTGNRQQNAAPQGRVMAAFTAIYLIWGSTYLGIRFAVETLPPFLMGGSRFLVAGAILYVWQRCQGAPVPARFHWRNAIVVGALLLGIGNGGVNWAEQRVASSIAALLIAATPLWFAVLDWLRPGGRRPYFQTMIGIATGFAGMVLLVTSQGKVNSHAIDPSGTAALMLASFCWAAGSLYARYTPKPEAPLMGVALQMITGGMVLLGAGLVVGESAALDWTEVSFRSAVAFVYLTIVGSLIGFTAYSWLLKVSTPERVSTYAYVNPVIAVFLGWACAGEVLTLRTLWAAAIIVLGVIIITTRRTAVRLGDKVNELQVMASSGVPKAGREMP
ncbi:MAG: EamA family transporter [Verrucomicrobiota bacterium]